MAEDPGWEKRVKEVANGIGAITAVVAASVGLIKEVTGSALPVLKEHPAIRWLLLVAVLALGIALWLKRPRRRAEVPLAAPRPLVGRDRDLENILTACVSHRLVFLIGESGVGKSALIEQALRPAIEKDKRFTLVVVRDWGDDWIKGPERMMAAAVEALGAGDASAGVTVSWIEYAESLAKRQLGRLLIVFDGFDDYSVRFHDRLFVHNENRFLTPAQLCDANPFWRAIDKLLRDELIHCMFVTRDDTQKALGPVRFVEPNERYLFKLSRTTARELIESTIKSTDDRDWSSLCDALLDDLDDGGVLPAQVVSAERALRRLTRRTVREYRAKGGLIGLELEQLLEVVNQAARAAGVPITSVLQLLNRMTDEFANPPKARSLTINAAAFPSTGLMSFAAVRTVIQVLADEHVVRTQPGDNWILYHDYAARTVAALRRRNDHWTARMAAARKRAREARGPIARYFSLLSPVAQLVLVTQRIAAFGRSGAFRYAEFRGFALLSLIRLVPWIAAVVGAGYAWNRAESTEAGRQLFARFTGHTVSPQPSEVDALWQLKGASGSVQRAFIDHAFAMPESAAVLSRHADYIAHAIVGFDGSRRAQLLDDVRAQCLDRSDLDPRVAAACLRIGLTLEDDREAFWVFAFKALLRAMDDSLAASANYEPDSSLDDWITWLAQSPRPRLLPDAAASAWFEGLASLLGRPPLRSAADARGDRVGQGVQSVLAHLELKAPQALAIQLVSLVVASRRLTPKIRRDLMWRFAVDAGPGIDIPALAKLVVESADLRDNSGLSVPNQEIKGTAALFQRLIDHARDPTIREPLLHALDSMFHDAPIEASPERDRLRDQLSGALAPPPDQPPARGAGSKVVIDDYDDPFAREELDKLKTVIHRKLPTVAPQLTRLVGPSFVEDFRKEADRWLNLPGVPASEVVDQFWELTRDHPAQCVVAASVAQSQFAKTFKAVMAGLKPGGHNAKDSWLRACAAAATALDPDRELDEPRSKRNAQATAENAVKDIVTGRNALSDIRSTQLSLLRSEGKLTADSARNLISRIYQYAINNPEQLRDAIGLANTVAGKVDDPRALANQIVKHDQTDTVESIAIMLNVLATIDKPALEVDGLDGWLVQIVKRMRANLQPSWSSSLADVCRKLSTGQALVYRHILDALSTTSDVPLSEALRPCLIGLRSTWSGGIDMHEIIRLLEWPTCVARCRSDLISMLKNEGRDVSSFWAVVAWARSEHLLPQRPVTRPHTN